MDEQQSFINSVADKFANTAKQYGASNEWIDWARNYGENFGHFVSEVPSSESILEDFGMSNMPLDFSKMKGSPSLLKNYVYGKAFAQMPNEEKEASIFEKSLMNENIKSAIENKSFDDLLEINSALSEKNGLQNIIGSYTAPPISNSELRPAPEFQGSSSLQPEAQRIPSPNPKTMPTPEGHSQSASAAEVLPQPSIVGPEIPRPSHVPVATSGPPIVTGGQIQTTNSESNLPVITGESAPSTFIRRNVGQNKTDDFSGTTIDVTGQDVGGPPPSGSALPPPKENGKHGRLDDINDHIEKKYNAAIFNAAKAGKDLDAVDKAATTAAESFRYKRFAHVAQGLKDKFAQEEAQRFVNARKSGETDKARSYLDYVSEHRNELMGDSSLGAQKQFGGMLDNMIDRRDKLQAEVDRLRGELKDSPAVKQSLIDNAKLTKMQKLKINAGSAAGIVKTAASHPMKFISALRDDERAGEYVMGKLHSYGTRADAMASAYKTQNGMRQYEKEHNRMDEIRRARLAEKEQQLEKFNNLDSNAAVFSAANDVSAKRRVGERLIGRKNGASATEAVKKFGGHGWKAKAGAVGGLLALGAVLGNMMGNHGEQSNAQLYNPNPQPQYAN